MSQKEERDTITSDEGGSKRILSQGQRKLSIQL